MKDYYRKNILEFSNLQLEKKYKKNKKGPDEFDSAGLTYYIFKELFNIDISQKGYGKTDTAKQMTSNIGILTKYQEHDLQKINYIKKIKIGDLVFFHTKSQNNNLPLNNNKYPEHVGIYIGNKQFIHASEIEKKVITNNITEEKWLKKLIGSKNIIDEII